MYLFVIHTHSFHTLQCCFNTKYMISYDIHKYVKALFHGTYWNKIMSNNITEKQWIMKTTY